MRNGTLSRLAIGHLIVDEAQDFDEVQIEWILSHAENGIATTLVADDDQSIYRFRYAQGLQGLRRYSNRVGLSHDDWLYLAENFRSHAEIVRWSQALIRHARDRVDKRINAPRGAGGQVDCLSFKNEEEELTRLALTLKPEPSVWAVLARKNKQLDRVELALDQRGIPYWREPTEGIWETGIGLAVISLLSSLVAPANVTATLVNSLILLDAFRAAQDERKRIVDADNVEVLFKFIQVESTCLSPDESKQFALRALKQQWTGWRARLSDSEGDNEANRLTRTKEVIKDVQVWLSMLVPAKNKALLKAIFGCLLKRRGHLENRIKASSYKKVDPAEGAVLSTMHGAKGLEFENVWVVGLDAANEDNLGSDEIEDERRLVYVAFTRSKSRLTASFVTEKRASRFLTEAELYAEPSRKKRSRASIYGVPTRGLNAAA